MKASDVIANFLIDRGINVVFGIIGSANSHIYDSFAKSGIRILNVHNEQAAVLAAGAFYRTSGRMAVALVTAGGGVTNSVTGIVSLWADSIPVIVLSGQEATVYLRDHAHRRMYGTQGLNFVKMVEYTTKRAVTVIDPNTLQDELEQAHLIATEGRKGPVVIDLPFDVQSKDVVQRPWNTLEPITVHPCEDLVQQVFELLKTAKRPVILGGHGIKLSGSTQIFKSMLNYTKIPVLLTWSAIDVIGHDHPLFCGSPGIYGQRAANFIFQKSDLIIVIGSRLTLPQTGYNSSELARGAKIVMVDIDESEFKEFVHVKIHSDCGLFLKQFSAYEYERPEWLDECRRLRRSWPLVEDAHIDTEFPNSYRVIDRISEFIKPEHVIVTDMGTALLSGHQTIRLKEGTTMFSSYGLGEMGYGLPAAFGAAIAAPAKEVLCLNCDGGMMMNLQELQTIIQHNLRIKIVIFNNDGYLMIKHTQKMLFENMNSVNKDTGIVLPDYMKVADAFGYEKYCIKSWPEFDFYFPNFMKYDGPAICEIYMPPTQDFIPKVKGILQKERGIFAPPIEEMSPILPLNLIESTMGNLISKESYLISRPTREQ